MEITIKRASACSLGELTDLWNEGFSDYFVPMKFTVEMFTNRFALDDLKPSLSVVAFIDDRPVGIILNGIRMVQGKKVAWNGGTCVSPEYRRYGVGKALMDASLAIYREEGVELATLEAFKDNARAIALYEQKGYKVIGHLEHYELRDAVNPISYDSHSSYTFKTGIPYDASKLDFYNNDLPWQSNWFNLRAGGESLIIYDKDQAVGYLIFRRNYDEHGKVRDIVLFQCEIDPQRQDEEEIVRFGLSQLFAAENPIPRCASFNTLSSQAVLKGILTSSGFTLRIEQVYMTMEL